MMYGMRDAMYPAFCTALSRTLAHEGGYVNDPDDRGGETYCGISRQAHPNWSGWDLVAEGAGRDALMPHVEALYHEHYWRPVAMAQTQYGQTLNSKLFDVAVNMGVRRAVMALQAALNVLLPKGQALTVDGVAGPLTRSTVHEMEGSGRVRELVALIGQEQRLHYERIVASDPSQAKFLRGWIRRSVA